MIDHDKFDELTPNQKFFCMVLYLMENRDMTPYKTKLFERENGFHIRHITTWIAKNEFKYLSTIINKTVNYYNSYNEILNVNADFTFNPDYSQRINEEFLGIKESLKVSAMYPDKYSNKVNYENQLNELFDHNRKPGYYRLNSDMFDTIENKLFDYNRKKVIYHEKFTNKLIKLMNIM
jgi:hypothetical protein